MTIPENIRQACMIAGHDPETPAGAYFVGMALVSQSMDAFRAEIEKARQNERGDAVLTVSQLMDEYELSESWIRTRIRRERNPIPLLIDDGIQRIRRCDFEAWLSSEATGKHNSEDSSKPELIIEFPKPGAVRNYKKNRPQQKTVTGTKK